MNFFLFSVSFSFEMALTSSFLRLCVCVLQYPQALVQEMAGKVVMDQHPAGLGLGLGLSQTMGG